MLSRTVIHTDRTSPRFVIGGCFYLRVSHYVLTLSYLQPYISDVHRWCNFFSIRCGPYLPEVRVGRELSCHRMAPGERAARAKKAKRVNVGNGDLQ